MSKADPNIYIKSPIIRPEDVDLNTLHKLGEDSFPLWALTTGVRADGNLLDFEKHRYLLPLYADSSDYMVVIKAAQLGLSVYMMLRLLYWCVTHDNRKAALYLPTRESADNMSSDRLDPMIKSAPQVDHMHIDSGSKLSLRKFTNGASLYIYHLGGVASKDSVPLDFLAFDEVRLVNPKDIDQTMERIAHSPYAISLFASTCGMENDTIDARFKRGSQHIYMVRCGCPDGCDLARQWPECVVDDKKRKRLYLRCTKCKWEIKDTQNARYVPHNPGASYNSYHMCQLHSKYISLQKIWDFYNSTTNLPEFYRSKLGIPFTDEDNRGVSLEQLKSCIIYDFPWYIHDSSKGKPRTAMGIDQGGGYIYVTIVDVHPDGTKKRLRHCEIIERWNPRYFSPEGKQQSPFVRAAELMNEFNVGLCVVDGMPNYDDALSFAQKFPGRVYTAHYQENQKDVVVWGDRIQYKEGVRKAGAKFKFKYHVMINRFTGFDTLFGDLRHGTYQFPDPSKLVQVCRDEKNLEGMRPEAIGWRLFDMLTRLVKQFEETNPETGQGKWSWVFPGGLDPHFSHSLLYASVALERLRKQAVFTFA